MKWGVRWEEWRMSNAEWRVKGVWEDSKSIEKSVSVRSEEFCWRFTPDKVVIRVWRVTYWVFPGGTSRNSSAVHSKTIGSFFSEFCTSFFWECPMRFLTKFIRSPRWKSLPVFFRNLQDSLKQCLEAGPRGAVVTRWLQKRMVIGLIRTHTWHLQFGICNSSSVALPGWSGWYWPKNWIFSSWDVTSGKRKMKQQGTIFFETTSTSQKLYSIHSRRHTNQQWRQPRCTIWSSDSVAKQHYNFN